MHSIFKKGLAAARKNFVPGVLLQGVALVVVLLYYFCPSARELLIEVADFKERMGQLFPVVATAIFGGFIPFVIMVLQKDIPRGMHLRTLFFLLGFWALLGLCVDYLYKAQALMFGDEPGVFVVAKKVCFDQFVFNILFAAPVSLIAMKWKECGFSSRELKQQLSRRVITFELPTVLISLWSVWIPTMAIVYSLPLALQFPLFNIVLCFWSLLLTALSRTPSD